LSLVIRVLVAQPVIEVTAKLMRNKFLNIDGGIVQIQILSKIKKI
jgi:hypothetical protein